jgi:molybdopterin molybdotransferase
MNEQRRESPYPMVSVEEATRTITAHCVPVGTQEETILTASGMVLAQDILSAENIPDVPKSLVDGYAVQAEDGMAERRVVAELTAGTANDRAVDPGTAIRIMTGAPLPPGADAVIMIEQTSEQAGMVSLRRAVQPGDNVRQPGDDVARQELVLAQGTVLGAAEIGLLSSIGHTRVQVYRRPRVAVLSTGNEISEPDVPRAPGMVRDSNRYALLTAVREAGCEAISMGIARDDVAVQRAAIERCLEVADVVITSGGVSMGSRDLIKPILTALGTIHFGRTASKPGKPVTFATIADKLVFGMPGFPVSSLVSFEVYVRPALRRLQGDKQPERPRVRIQLADPIRPPRDRVEYQRAVVRWQDGRLVASSTGIQFSTRLLSMRGANALLIVPVGDEVYPPGTELDALLTGPLVQT